MRERFLRRFVFFAVGASGAAALAFEVAWTRTLSTVMGSSTYALSTMLAAFMAGLSLGGALGAVASVRARRPAMAFAFCELGIGTMGLLVAPVMRSLTPVYIAAYYGLHDSFLAFSAVQFLMAFMLMGVPTTLMGMTFPLAVRMFTDWRGQPGRESGRLYSANTLGGIAGSLAAGFLLIPIVGVTRTAAVAGCLDVANALVILSLVGGLRSIGAALALVLAAGASALAIRPPPAPVFGFGYARRFGSSELARRVAERADAMDVLMDHEDADGDVWLIRARAGTNPDLVLLNESKLEGGDDAGFALLAELPYFAHRLVAPARSALSIGLGSGHTLRKLAELPLDSIVSVELSQGVVEANRRFLSPDLFADRRIRHVRADGRNHLLLARESWDLVLVSPSWATDEASGALLTDEFFALAASRLAPGGVIGVWVDFSTMRDEDMSRLLRTFARSFRHLTAWRVPGGDVVLVGSNSGRYADESAVARLALEATPEARGMLEVALSDTAPRPRSFDDLNTDDRPVLEFDSARDLVVGPGWAMAPQDGGLVHSHTQ